MNKRTERINRCKLARMAELVDALVSKTSSLWSAGSPPAPGTIILTPLNHSYTTNYNWHYIFFQHPIKSAKLVLRESE